MLARSAHCSQVKCKSASTYDLHNMRTSAEGKGNAGPYIEFMTAAEAPATVTKP